MSKQPDQAIHDGLFEVLQGQGHEVYLILPLEGAGLPFVKMGESDLFPLFTKSYAVGRVRLTIHVFGKIGHRKAISEILADAIRLGGEMRKADSYACSLSRATSRILVDDSTAEPLFHGVAELDFNFRYKEEDTDD